MINLRHFFFLSSLVLLLNLISAFSAHAQTKEQERVLIRNVILFDPKGVAEDKLVNILIRNNKLDTLEKPS